MIIDSYESWARVAVLPDPEVAPINEAFRGQDIVVWYGGIERQLISLVDKYRNSKQFEDASKVEQYLITWRRHQITGSINRSSIESLESAAAQLAVDGWKSQNYFSALRDQLRKLVASEEELPRLPDDSVANELPTGGGRRRPSTMFGGSETKKPAPPEGKPKETPALGGTPGGQAAGATPPGKPALSAGSAAPTP